MDVSSYLIYIYIYIFMYVYIYIHTYIDITEPYLISCSPKPNKKAKRVPSGKGSHYAMALGFPVDHAGMIRICR